MTGPQYPQAGPYAGYGPQAYGPQGYVPKPFDPTDCVGKRVGAALIDAAILLIPTYVPLIGAIVWMVASAEEVYDPYYGSTTEPSGAAFAAFFLAIGLTWVIQFLYSWITVVLWHGTPGIRAVGLRCVNGNGTVPISWGKSAARAALWMVFDNGLIALIVVLCTKGHRRVADILCKTLVIPKEYAGRFHEFYPPDGVPPWDRPAPMYYPQQYGYPTQPPYMAPPAPR